MLCFLGPLPDLCTSLVVDLLQCYHPELAISQDGFENGCCVSCNINTGRIFYPGRESNTVSNKERSPANVLEQSTQFANHPFSIELAVLLDFLRKTIAW